MIIQLLVGVAMAYGGFYGHSQFSPILFVEGMVIANLAIFSGGGFFKKKSINFL